MERKDRSGFSGGKRPKYSCEILLQIEFFLRELRIEKLIKRFAQICFNILIGSFLPQNAKKGTFLNEDINLAPRIVSNV